MGKEYHWSTRLMVLTGMALFFIVLLSFVASAKTITVDDDGGADYMRIQDAIDNSDDDDFIRVYNGTYYENVIVDKSIVMIGDGIGNTIIRPEVYGNIITIVSNWVEINGFHLEEDDDVGVDIAILVDSDHNTIAEVNCSNTSYGIFLAGSRNILKSCQIHNCSNSGVEVRGNDNLITNCTISSNAYGIGIELGRKNKIRSCMIIGNDYYGVSTMYDYCGEDTNSYIDNHFEDNGQGNIHASKESLGNFEIRECDLYPPVFCGLFCLSTVFIFEIITNYRYKLKRRKNAQIIKQWNSRLPPR